MFKWFKRNNFHFSKSFRNELRYFSRMTKKVADPTKINVIIMGRKTFFGIPASKLPLPDRINIVLTRDPSANKYPESVIVCSSMEEALGKIGEMENKIENVWIVGGNSVYKEAMGMDNCHRIYFTKIMSTFECDAFFPEMTEEFKKVANDDDVPTEIQEENGVKYQYQIFEKTH